MKMSELVTKQITFELEEKGEHFLRPYTLRDAIWLEEKYTAEERATLFDGQFFNMDLVVNIVWRLLINRELYKAVEIDAIDDEGREIKTLFGGIDMFFHGIVGEGEKIKVATACVKAMNASNPIAKEGGSKKKDQTNQKDGI